ncbi:EAL domain-containing protein [Tolumonas lignilytica]|uniref:EAL domain-containing protein n=1 Tax=Tolumonas lignilytica TaxID=1283284 RepID=UPI00046320B7|nr:EAL domain-containing protein [Tolumonas lignilytica]
MAADNPEVVIIIADISRQQWLYALLSRYYHVRTKLPDDDAVRKIALYLFDEPALQLHLPWLEQWRRSIQPDSPSVLLLSDTNQTSLSEELQGLVDEVLPADMEAEHLREHINQWLRLRDSVQIWMKASSSKQILAEPLSHPTSVLNNVPIKRNTNDSLLTDISLPDGLKSDLLTLFFESSSQGMFICDMQGCLIAVNPAFSAVVGYTQEELKGSQPDFLLPLRGNDDYYKEFRRLVYEQNGWDGELSGRRKDGDIFPLWLTLRFYPTQPELVEGVKEGYYIGILTDLSVSRMLEDSVIQLSRTDSLSELNRVLLEERLTLDIRQAERHQQKVAVFYINLRRFRAINDRFGYAIGDWVLMAQLQRLRNLVGCNGMVCRLFANNYVLVLPELNDLVPAMTLADTIMEQLSQPLFYDRKEIVCHPVIGIADYPQHGNNAAELIRNADTAMDWCRHNGECHIQLFSADLHADLQQRLNLERELKQALQNKEFFLEYQPQLTMKSGGVNSVEALIRWRSSRGVMQPKDFISFAEECDLIIPISTWVLNEACRQGACWIEEGFNVTIAVNLSASHFQNDMLVEQVSSALQSSGFPAKMLELEVTESCIMLEVSKSINTLNELKALGVSLSVDDFGTGYSSLSYLKLFPLDKLKIDQSFVHDLSVSNSDAVIVRAIIALGHAMGLSIVAEGVETQEQYALLRSWQCDAMQGFLFSPPTTASALPAIAQKITAQSQEHPTSPTVKETKHVLLLVDDEPSILNALRRTLRSGDYQIITANGAEEAMDALARYDVGVIVSDNRMPGVSGIELLRQVKERYPQIIRIMLSGYADFTSLSAAINAGEIFRFLSKPWEDDQIKSAVRDGFVKFDDQRLLNKISN